MFGQKLVGKEMLIILDMLLGSNCLIEAAIGIHIRIDICMCMGVVTMVWDYVCMVHM